MIRDVGPEIIKFAIVGCIAVLVQYSAYIILLRFLEHNYSLAIAYALSLIVNYIMTTSFTYRTHRNAMNGIGFFLCHVINFTLQFVLLNFFVSIGICKELAPIPMFLVCIPTNFLLVRLVMKKL